MSGVGRSYRVISCDLFTGRNLRLSRQVFHQNRKRFYCQCEKKTAGSCCTFFVAIS